MTGQPKNTRNTPRGGRRALAARSVLSAGSLAVVLAASLAFAIGAGSIPSFPPRPVQGPEGWETMTIDGNRNGDRVTFSHAKHSGSYAGECRSCHHLSMPAGGESSCARCHRDMDAPASMFDHDAHIARDTARGSCDRCHRGDASPKNILACDNCHWYYPGATKGYLAVRGYRDALHGLCRSCHEEAFAGTREKGSCNFCHRR